MKLIIDIDDKRIKGIKLLAKEQDIETPYPTLEQIISNGTPLKDEDFTELRDRFGNEVEFVVRDMISGKGERWKS